MQTLQGESALSVLRQLSSLIAWDCVLNNVDRVHAIWHNDGNLSNVSCGHRPAGQRDRRRLRQDEVPEEPRGILR